MPQIAYRGNLSSAIFPMLLSSGGRTVINPQADQNFDRRVDPEGEQKNAGIPQALYMENVFPTANGYQSVGFKPRTLIPIPAGSWVRAEITLPIPNTVTGVWEKHTLVFFNSNTIVSNTGDYSGAWTAVILPLGFSSPILPRDLFPAVVRGVTYLFDASKGIFYTLTVTAGVVTLVNANASITGLGAAPFLSIKSITSAYNYLIVVSFLDVYWSSTTTPTDFVPSLISGAGTEQLTNNKGAITTVIEHPAGFIVYTSTNIISAAYTGNSRYPWKFVEVSNSGGIKAENYKQRYPVTGSLNSSQHFTISDTGNIQLITMLEASNVAPEATLYLSRSSIYDVFNSIYKTFSQVKDTNLVQSQMQRTVYFYSDRYIIIPYSGVYNSTQTSLTYRYALVYDNLLQRYGKIKRNFTHIEEGQNGQLIFIDSKTGIVWELILDIYDSDVVFNTSMLLLGKFQFIRNRLIQMEEISLESAQDTAISPQTLAVNLLPSLDGKNFDNPSALTARSDSSGELLVYNCHKTGKNHSVLLEGAFDLNTIELKFTLGGTL
jgi:hypothetical protein